MDIIFGLHSIANALNNSKRSRKQVFATEDGLQELKKLHFNGRSLPEDAEVSLLSPHKLQETSKGYLREADFREQRVPSHIFLVCDSLENESITAVYDALEANTSVKIIALDKLTDIHNLAAISRTACFYGVDFILLSKKGELKLPPSYFRIASGAYEYLKIINVPSLPQALNKITQKGIHCIGLAEEAEGDSSDIRQIEKVCLVMGAEDSGLSNATRRILTDFVSLKSQGQIKSLNVSVAAALAMEKILK